MLRDRRTSGSFILGSLDDVMVLAAFRDDYFRGPKLNLYCAGIYAP